MQPDEATKLIREFDASASNLTLQTAGTHNHASYIHTKEQFEKIRRELFTKLTGKPPTTCDERDMDL